MALNRIFASFIAVLTVVRGLAGFMNLDE
jgi:uncharacterized protein YpuA (DUF1002 family)